MQSFEKIPVAFTLLALGGWLWLAPFDPSNAPGEATTQPKGEDYYIEGVRISGQDENGIRFLLIAQRQHRNGENDPAILVRPRLTQFDEQHGERKTSAWHGEIRADGSELTLTGKESIPCLYPNTWRSTNNRQADESFCSNMGSHSVKQRLISERADCKVWIVQEKTTDRPCTVTDTKQLTIRLASKG